MRVGYGVNPTQLPSLAKMASSIFRSRISSLIFSRTKWIRNRQGFSTANVSPPLTLARNPSSPIPPPPPRPRRFRLLSRRRRPLAPLGGALISSSTASSRPPPAPPPSPATPLTFLVAAYTLDEVEERTKRFRESVNVTLSDDAPPLEKYKGLLYSAAMTVPLKATELYLDARRLVEEQVRGFTEPISDKLLPDLHPQEQHVFTLVLDLNETIIFSDWKRERGWRTFKRPGVDAFLQHLAQFYEIVVYSDQLNMYVDPVVDRLDQNHCIRYRLSRGATKYQDNKHYRDLSKLNRDPAKILYVSANAFESCLQPENCVPIKPFKLDDKGDAPDTTLLDLLPFLEYVARNSPPDIRQVLASYKKEDIA